MNLSEDSGRTVDEPHSNTRRQFVVGSAGALGGLAIGGALSGSAFAQEDGEEEDNGEEDEEEEMPESEFEDDVDILNYALTIEYLEASFYEEGLENISEEEFCNCQALSEDSYLQENLMEELETIQEHEEEHVEALTATIEDLDGEPIEEPEFDFGATVEYPMAFLGTAAQLEDIGVSAYAGAAPYIENEDLLPPALGIHSVEARHASYLRTLTAQTPFPDVIDEARSRPQVLELASQFIVGEDGEPDDDLDDDEDLDDEEPDDDEDIEDEEPDDEDLDDEEPDDDDDELDDDDMESPNGNETDTGTPNGNETDTGSPNGNETDS